MIYPLFSGRTGDDNLKRTQVLAGKKVKPTKQAIATASYPEVSLSRAKERGKEKTGGWPLFFLLPIFPCASSPVTRLCTKNEASAEEVAIATMAT